MTTNERMNASRYKHFNDNATGKIKSPFTWVKDLFDLSPIICYLLLNLSVSGMEFIFVD